MYSKLDNTYFVKNLSELPVKELQLGNVIITEEQNDSDKYVDFYDPNDCKKPITSLKILSNIIHKQLYVFTSRNYYIFDKTNKSKSNTLIDNKVSYSYKENKEIYIELENKLYKLGVSSNLSIFNINNVTHPYNTKPIREMYTILSRNNLEIIYSLKFNKIYKNENNEVIHFFAIPLLNGFLVFYIYAKIDPNKYLWQTYKSIFIMLNDGTILTSRDEDINFNEIFNIAKQYNNKYQEYFEEFKQNLKTIESNIINEYIVKKNYHIFNDIKKLFDNKIFIHDIEKMCLPIYSSDDIDVYLESYYELSNDIIYSLYLYNRNKNKMILQYDINTNKDLCEIYLISGAIANFKLNKKLKFDLCEGEFNPYNGELKVDGKILEPLYKDEKGIVYDVGVRFLLYKYCLKLKDYYVLINELNPGLLQNELNELKERHRIYNELNQ